MGQGFLRLDAIEITVLDEADHMADLGFLPVVTKSWQQRPPAHSAFSSRQRWITG
jgi:superfamily II DNA/RNA helicase